MNKKLEKAKTAVEIAGDLGLWDKLKAWFKGRRAKRRLRRAMRKSRKGASGQ